MTARCHPGMNTRTSGPPRVHVADQHGVGPGLGAQLSAQLGPVAVRAEEQVRHVGARHRNRPPVHREVDHQRRPLDTVGAQVAHGHHARRLNRELGPHQHGDAPRPRLGLLPARHRLDFRRLGAARRPCTAPCSRPPRTARALQVSGGSGWGRMRRPSPRVCACSWYPSMRAASAAWPPPPSPRARPHLLEHDDIGIERGDGGEIVVGPAPPVDPAVHVVVGDAEHGPPDDRRATSPLVRSSRWQRGMRI